MEFHAALDVVYRALDTVNDLRSSNEQIAKSPDARLAGVDGHLDSFALVTLALAVERDVTDVEGREVVLFDEREFEQNLTHFASVNTLARFIVERTAE